MLNQLRKVEVSEYISLGCSLVEHSVELESFRDIQLLVPYSGVMIELTLLQRKSLQE